MGPLTIGIATDRAGVEGHGSKQENKGETHEEET
jgi:hypothetical protein